MYVCTLSLTCYPFRSTSLSTSALFFFVCFEDLSMHHIIWHRTVSHLPLLKCCRILCVMPVLVDLGWVHTNYNFSSFPWWTMSSSPRNKNTSWHLTCAFSLLSFLLFSTLCSSLMKGFVNTYFNGASARQTTYKNETNNLQIMYVSYFFMVKVKSLTQGHVWLGFKWSGIMP